MELLDKQYHKEKPKVTKAAFDELTTRMRKNRLAMEPHDCVLNKNIIINDEDIIEYNKYFGDTSKITNRVTKKI
jgi:hypothetical protein